MAKHQLKLCSTATLTSTELRLLRLVDENPGIRLDVLGSLFWGNKKKGYQGRTSAILGRLAANGLVRIRLESEGVPNTTLGAGHTQVTQHYHTTKKAYDMLNSNDIIL